MKDVNLDGIQAVYPPANAIAQSGIRALQGEANKLANYILKSHVTNQGYENIS